MLTRLGIRADPHVIGSDVECLQFIKAFSDDDVGKRDAIVHEATHNIDEWFPSILLGHLKWI